MNKGEKYLSIITNFGCHFNCPYCIVKNNNIDVPRTTVKSLKMLKAAVEYENATIISVSGGGDPLHNYDKNTKYYNKLFKICKELKLPIEMHTSYIDSEFPYEKCYRVVYHCSSLEQAATIRRHGDELIRVVFVVTEDFTKEKIDEIAAFVRESEVIDELSFRQMVDKNYRVTKYCQDYLKSGHREKWYYIEQGDYNSYFVNGVIYYKYSEISSYGSRRETV